MDAISVLKSGGKVRSNYDAEADVLYVSLGEPRSAEAVDVGNGLVLRYDAERQEVVGLTVIGVRERLWRELHAE